MQFEIKLQYWELIQYQTLLHSIAHINRKICFTGFLVWQVTVQKAFLRHAGLLPGPNSDIQALFSFQQVSMGGSTIIPDKWWSRTRCIFWNAFKVLPDYSSGQDIILLLLALQDICRKTFLSTRIVYEVTATGPTPLFWRLDREESRSPNSVDRRREEKLFCLPL